MQFLRCQISELERDNKLLKEQVQTERRFVKETIEKFERQRARLAVLEAAIDLLELPAEVEDKVLEDAKRECLGDPMYDRIVEYIKEVKSLC